MGATDVLLCAFGPIGCATALIHWAINYFTR
jgi:hypothetical protein